MFFPNMAFASDKAIIPLPVTMEYTTPAMGSRQGLLTIHNVDCRNYRLVINYKEHKLFLYGEWQTIQGIQVPSGSSLTIAMDKDTYSLRTANSESLKVKIRKGRITTLSLQPFGTANFCGLLGMVDDGENTRTETLFRQGEIASSVAIIQPKVVSPLVVAQPSPSVAYVVPAPPVVTRVYTPAPIVVRPHFYRPRGGGFIYVDKDKGKVYGHYRRW